MKVLIITSDNIDKKTFHNATILSWTEANSKANEINFSDYDGIILDADSIQKEKNTLTPNIVTNIRGYYQLEEYISPSIINDLFQRKNSFFTLIGNPSAVVASKSISSLLGFKIKTEEKSGNNIEINEEDSLYNEYWNEITEYNYYIESFECLKAYERYHLDFDDNISNRSKYIIGVCLFMEENGYDYYNYMGPISFVPPLKTKQATLEKILSIHSTSEDTPEESPIWVNSYIVANQKELDDKIDKLTNKIEAIRQCRDDLEKQRDNARSALNCLWATEKQLEYEVKSLLKGAGFDIEEPEVGNAVEFCAKYKDKKFVVEVKSTQKEYIDKKGLRQVSEWKDDKELDGESDYKALLVVSNQTPIDPAKRNPNPLPDNLSAFAEKHDICVVTVNTLFMLTQQIKLKENTAEGLADTIHKTQGLLQIEDVISTYKQKIDKK